MGKTKYEKEFEKLSKSEKEKILNIIRHLFIDEMKTDEEIGKFLNIPKTAVKAIRINNNIKKSRSDITKANAKRNAIKYMNGELNKSLSATIYNELNDEYKQMIIQNVQLLINENKYNNNDINNKLNIGRDLIAFLKNNNLISIPQNHNQLLIEHTYSLKTLEEKQQEHENRVNAYKNMSNEQKDIIRKKRQETNLKKYGVIHNWQKPEIREKVNNNNLKKYGTKNALNGYIAKQTKLDRYGDENYNNREKYKETYKSFSQEKLDNIKLKTQQTCLKKYNTTHHMKNKEIQLKLQNTFLEKYGVTSPMLLHPNNNAISKYNLKFQKYIQDTLGITLELEFQLYNHYYDFKYNNILIELNPSISHNSSISFAHLTGLCTEPNCKKHLPLDKNYHFKKWLLAKNSGYELISIFDWYDLEKVISLLKSKLQLNTNKIGARKTVIKQIDTKMSKDFLNKNHILGYDRSSDVIYGLFYDDLLVSVMSFGKPRYAKDYDWELLRFANLSDYSIYGSASKLWKQFILDYNPNSVITYTNNDFGNGNVYTKLGFECSDILKSNRVWNIPYKNIFIKHTSLIRQGADRLLKNKIDNYFTVGLDKNDFIARGGKEEYCKEYSNLPENTDWWPGNIDIMRHYGFVDVYSSGTSVYIYKK